MQLYKLKVLAETQHLTILQRESVPLEPLQQVFHTSLFFFFSSFFTSPSVFPFLLGLFMPYSLNNFLQV